MSYALIFFYSILNVFAQLPSEFTCPADHLKVEYKTTQNHLKLFCVKSHNGAHIQNGDEIIYDVNNNIISKKFYLEGKESEKPQEIKTINIEISEALKKLMRIFQKGKLNAVTNEFTAHACDKNPALWLKLAITKAPQNFQYRFGELCDVDGTFEAHLEKEFLMSFKLRNLYNYNRTEMKVIQTLNKIDKSLEYKFTINSGELYSDKEKILFNGSYRIELNPLTGRPKLDTQIGQITLLQVNDIKIHNTYDVVY